MFSSKHTTKSMAIYGPAEFTKSFIFEAAVHWAELGRRVIYITQAPLESLPSIYHDRNKFSTSAFKLMRFMYLPTYEDLVNQLVDLHTFATLPSVLLIDDLDSYIFDSATIAAKQEQLSLEVHVARLCAFIQDSTNACSRILKNSMHLCVSITSREIANGPCSIYFDDIWRLRLINVEDDNFRDLELSRYGRTTDADFGAGKIFRFKKSSDGTIVMKKIYEKIFFTSHGVGTP